MCYLYLNNQCVIQQINQFTTWKIILTISTKKKRQKINVMYLTIENINLNIR